MYSIVYPKIYCSTENRGFDLKSLFLVVLFFKQKKKAELGKDQKCYENRKNVNFAEQKPILIYNFIKEEEDLVQKAEACKRKRRAVAEKNKELKRKKRQTENEEKEKNFGSDCAQQCCVLKMLSAMQKSHHKQYPCLGHSNLILFKMFHG